MSGLIVVDKPIGYTSRDVVNIVSKVLKEKKVGHTGTLDPLATGVLLLCVGKYTKLVDMLTMENKEYIAEIKLGLTTDTLDITGNVIASNNNLTTKQDILKVFSKFIGDYVMQVPKYSAIKVNGKKLYEYARKGEEITLPLKKVHIYELELLSFYQDIITFRCKVEKGTYIRSLIRDITKELHVLGTMNNLTRIKQGNFKIEEANSLEDIKNNNFKILHIKDALDIKEYELNDLEYKKVSNGNKIELPIEEANILLTYNQKEVAIYQKDDKLYKPKVMLI